MDSAKCSESRENGVCTATYPPPTTTTTPRYNSDQQSWSHTMRNVSSGNRFITVHEQYLELVTVRALFPMDGERRRRGWERRERRRRRRKKKESSCLLFYIYHTKEQGYDPVCRNERRSAIDKPEDCARKKRSNTHTHTVRRRRKKIGSKI